VNRLRWFGLMERMSEERLTKIIYNAEKMGEKRRGRPRIGRIEGVKSKRWRRPCMRASIRVEEAKDLCKDRVKWRSILSPYPARDMT
jgi:hypothetical protein